MYYKLADHFALRAWDLVGSTVIDLRNGTSQPLSSSKMQLLLLCDGENPFPAELLTDKQTAWMNKQIEKGNILVSEEPSPIAEKQRYHHYANRIFLDVLWSITGKCNCNCRHCYMDAPHGKYGALSTAQLLKMVDDMAACGIYRVELTGGEPLVRDDFWTIIDALRAHDITVGKIYSNGFLVTDELLDAFEQRGMKPGFSFSFDCIGWHDWLRGVKGAEEATLAAIRRCVARGFVVDVETCIHKGSAPMLADTIDLLAEMGVVAIKVSYISGTPLWLKNKEDLSLSIEEYAKAAIGYIPAFFERKPNISVLLCSVVRLDPVKMEYEVITRGEDSDSSEDEDGLNDLLCGATRTSLYIAPDGRVLPCMPMLTAESCLQYFPVIDKDMSLQQALSDSYYMSFVDKRVRDLIAENEECAACPHVISCKGGCRANAVIGEGKLMACDRNLCTLLSNGYDKLIRQTAEEARAKYC